IDSLQHKLLLDSFLGGPTRCYWFIGHVLILLRFNLSENFSWLSFGFFGLFWLFPCLFSCLKALHSPNCFSPDA
ncbi:MAG: hypothetical protein AAGC91_04195, partial [Pseudomonadota bacterium]